MNKINEIKCSPEREERIIELFNESEPVNIYECVDSYKASDVYKNQFLGNKVNMLYFAFFSGAVSMTNFIAGISSAGIFGLTLAGDAPRSFRQDQLEWDSVDLEKFDSTILDMNEVYGYMRIPNSAFREILSTRNAVQYALFPMNSTNETNPLCILTIETEMKKKKKMLSSISVKYSISLLVDNEELLLSDFRKSLSAIKPLHRQKEIG